MERWLKFLSKMNSVSVEEECRKEWRHFGARWRTPSVFVSLPGSPRVLCHQAPGHDSSPRRARQVLRVTLLLCKNNTNDPEEWYRRYLISWRKIKLYGCFFALVLNSGQINRNQGKEKKNKDVVKMSGIHPKHDFLSRNIYVEGYVLCLWSSNRERAPNEGWSQRQNPLCSSLNVLLKITVVHGKCWRMTALEHFCKVLYPN